MEKILGVDIGGTKCTVSYGYSNEDVLHPVDKYQFPTTTLNDTLANINDALSNMMKKHSLAQTDVSAIGICCGGPLNSQKGVVLSPPNLPGWDRIPIVDIIQTGFGIKAGLQNDANACALAEWKYGSGRGSANMVFMTFGTGLGAGLILDGKLYTGTNDNAGEVGHIRLSDYGPVGYGKAGAFEGFCSGGGIAQIAKMMVTEKMQMGMNVAWCTADQLDYITAKQVADEARKGDPLALQIFEISARNLGKGLSVIIDILNPEIIVIGGIYTRCRLLLEPIMLELIEKEALPNAGEVCRVMPAMLGEQIGDYAALSVASNLLPA